MHVRDYLMRFWDIGTSAGLRRFSDKPVAGGKVQMNFQENRRTVEKVVAGGKHSNMPQIFFARNAKSVVKVALVFSFCLDQETGTMCGTEDFPKKILHAKTQLLLFASAFRRTKAEVS